MKKLLLSVLYCIIYISSSAQYTIFAELNGTPNINTTGWVITGIATPGDTPGDNDTNPDELILTPNTNWQSGAIYYGLPIDLTICKTFNVEFDMRMWGSTSGIFADGLAWWFLSNPPNGSSNGGNLGVPNNPRGIIVGLDTYDNCGANDNPEVQIRYGSGNGNYQECPNPPQPTVRNVSTLRSNAYQRVAINYDNGNIYVYVNNVLQLTGFYPINYSGYVGFSAATGSLNDQHSIKNVTIFTTAPVARAGQDKSVCSQDSIALGFATQPNVRYKWTPSTFLSNDTIAEPKFAAINNTPNPIKYTFVVSASDVGSGCFDLDTVEVTVLPNAKAPLITGNRFLCNGFDTIDLKINPLYNAQSYSWNHSNGNSIGSLNTDSLSIFGLPVGATSVTLYLLNATGGISACLTDTISINVLPLPIAPTLSGPTIICAINDIATYNITSKPNHNYTWIVNGGIILQQTTDSISVQWNTAGVNNIKLVEVNAAGCVSDTAYINVFTQTNIKPTIRFDYVTINKTDADVVNLKWHINSSVPMTRYQYLWYKVKGSNTWLLLDSVSVGNTNYTIRNLEVNAYSYEFQLTGEDECGTKVTSLPHNTILLKATQSNATIFTQWNGYINWADDVANYVLLRDKNTENSFSSIYTGNDSMYQVGVDQTLYQQCYRVKATQNNSDSTLSWSNIICLKFSPTFFFPTGFTPNNDNINENFNFVGQFINNYKLTVYNRWGEEVYLQQAGDGKEGWNGKLSNGECQVGMYTWVFDYEGFDDGALRWRRATGIVNLIK